MNNKDTGHWQLKWIQRLNNVDLLLIAIVCSLASLSQGLTVPINDDDTYYLHSIWLTGQGYVIYRDVLEAHPPGMLLLLSPWSWLVSGATAFILQARTLIAILFGAMVYLSGKIIDAKGIAALTLGLIAVLLSDYSEVYMFRVEFVAAFFVFLHLWLLTRLSRDNWVGMWAAAALTLACTMSVRPMVFMAVQPLLVILLWRQFNFLREMGKWFTGVLLGAFPSILYLGIHNLWSEAWFWCFRFPGTVNIGSRNIGFHFSVGFKEIVLLGFGTLCLYLLYINCRISLQNKLIIAIAWIIAYVFLMVNPIKMNYSVLYILLLSAVLVAVAVATAKEYLDKPVFHWLGVSLYIWFSAVVVITLTALLLIYNTTLFNLDRTNLRNQLAVIQWLEHVSQGQPVLLIGPNHPIVVPDVTDIHAPWPYILWIENPYLRQRVTGLAESVLRRPPSVISVDPWSNHTRGLNIVEWFFSKGLINRQEIETIIDLIRNNYWQVQFPELQPSQYGRTYWVRKDLLDGNIPGRYTISSPQVGTYTFAK